MMIKFKQVNENDKKNKKTDKCKRKLIKYIEPKYNTINII